MNRKEHILTIIAEECGEVAQRITKMLRFGVDEVTPGLEPHLDNNYRFYKEFADLLGMVEMAEDEGILISPDDDLMIKWKNDKVEKVEKYMEYSQKMGTLEEK